MVWTAIIGAAVSAYSARRSSRAAKDQSKFEALMSKEAVPLSGYEARRTAEYENALMERTMQRERERRAEAFRGLARQQGIVPEGYEFKNKIDIPELPANPVPNDEAYQRVSGLSQPTLTNTQPRG
jgi:hypothetical protein